MKITVLGAGSAFGLEQFQSNFWIEFEPGLNMLFDCGSDIRWALKEQGLSYNDIKMVYISHLHNDHIGGLEGLALNSYFNPSLGKPELILSQNLADDIWSNCLKGGLSTMQGVVLELNDWFKVWRMWDNYEKVLFGNDDSNRQYHLTTVQTVHIMSGYKIMPSYGLMIKKYNGNKIVKKVYITADTQYSPYQIRDFYEQADLILEDCETSEFKSHVHAHYNDLVLLEEKFKNKMWLYHYGDKWTEERNQKAIDDGFLGFLRQCQVLEI